MEKAGEQMKVREVEWLQTKNGFSVHLRDHTGVCLKDSEAVLRDRDISGTENKVGVGPQRKGREVRGSYRKVVPATGPPRCPSGEYQGHREAKQLGREGATPGWTTDDP